MTTRSDLTGLAIGATLDSLGANSGKRTRRNCGPASDQSSRRPFRHRSPERIHPRGQQHVGPGLDVSAQHGEGDDCRESSNPAGRRPFEEAVRRQERPGHPDRDIRDGEQEPDDQEPAKGVGEPGEPASPPTETPAPGEQVHSEAGDPEPGGGHPGIRLGERPEIGDQVERVEDGALALAR